MNRHPFDSLIGPLRYACELDFARLGTVKGLSLLLDGAAQQAAKVGVAPEPLKALRQELPGLGHASLEMRKASLRRILGYLEEAGLALPAELKTLVMISKTQPIPSAPKLKKIRKQQLPAENENTRLLSIAPKEGALAVEVNQAGRKIHARMLGALYRRGVRKVGDVLFMIPRAYEDRRNILNISQLVPGERGTTVGEVRSVGDGPPRGGRRTFRAVLADPTGSIAATYFQSGPWLKAKFPIGKRVVLSGEVRASSFGREITHPEVEPAEDLETSTIHFRRIVPVYSGFERHEQRSLRELTFRLSSQFAQAVEDPLPVAVRHSVGLLGLGEAIRRIHIPDPSDELERLSNHQSLAHQRLAFDELFFLQLGMALKRHGFKSQEGIAFQVTEQRLKQAKRALPFKLTRAQEKVIRQLMTDLARPTPMNRLLQGDVGSGKTAVAVVTSVFALLDGFQVAVMAPTEILAEQHQKTFGRLLEPLGFKVALLTSGGKVSERRDVRAALREGKIHVAIGTHALIQSDVSFKQLGLVVIDEQHRFGVLQRHTLKSKGVMPDCLVMTATPIPRTLAMTLYGDLDVSVIDELPPGRTPITTKVFSEAMRPSVYRLMEAEFQKGHQAYVVYPLVEESEKVDLADATQGAALLKEVFPAYRVGLLHGRMKEDEKEGVMRAFRNHELDILVSTTVIEVGVDVPNASMMVIEAAERFGLSQLHQLRGRVGRGAATSYCALVASRARSRESSERLAIMEKSNDGFVIAEKDLEIRGPGELLGTRQSGIPELAVANLARDQALLSEAREWARSILDRDPRLQFPEHQPLVKALEERWGGRLALAQVG